MGLKIKNIINGKTILLSVVWAVLTSTIVICHALCNFAGIDSEDGKVYYSIQHEGNPLSVSLDQFQKTYEDLKETFSQKGYQYVEVYYQYLESAKEDGKEFYTAEDVLEQSPDTIQALQISMNVLGDADVSKGRYFRNDDYLCSADAAIPVLMGAAYEGIYDLRDTFEASYLFQEHTFQIIGFLNEGTKILAGDGFLITDRYVVMPSFCLSGSDDGNDGYRIHYANKISGLVQAPQYDASDLERINTILADHEIGECSVQVFPYKYRKLQGVSILTLSRGVLVLLAAEFAGCLCMLVHGRRKPLQQGRGISWGFMLLLSVFWIYVLDGISRKTIGFIILSVKSILLLICIVFFSYIGIFWKRGQKCTGKSDL